MTKKQILATCLAGTLALGCLSGCANKKVENQEQELTLEDTLNQDNVIREGYIINITPATIKRGENGLFDYVAPDSSWVMFDNLCYQVSYRTVINATPIYNEDGTISYTVPAGYVLSGTIGYKDEVINDINLRNEILTDPLTKQETNKLTLK